VASLSLEAATHEEPLLQNRELTKNGNYILLSDNYILLWGLLSRKKHNILRTWVLLTPYAVVGLSCHLFSMVFFYTDR
jgi:hypothetical protein